MKDRRVIAANHSTLAAKHGAPGKVRRAISRAFALFFLPVFVLEMNCQPDYRQRRVGLYASVNMEKLFGFSVEFMRQP